MSRNRAMFARTHGIPAGFARIVSASRRYIALLAVLIPLAGCGGGGGSSPIIASVEPPITPPDPPITPPDPPITPPDPPITPPDPPITPPDPPVTPPGDDDEDRYTLDLPEPDGNLPDPVDPGTIDPITGTLVSIPPNYNQGAFQQIRLGEAYARDLTGKDVVIGIMEEVNHFHIEIMGDVGDKPKIHPDSILTSPYHYFFPQPDPKYIVDFDSWDRYPARACYLEFGFPCEDTSGDTKYFVRMPDGTLELIPGLEDFILTDAVTGQQERSEFGTQHGTAVASVSAAARNEDAHEDRIPLYGIAHEAQILVYARPMYIAGLSSSIRAQALYLRYAPEAADVYNFSHAYSYEVEDHTAQRREVTRSGFRILASAIERSGKVMVAAAGNDRYAYPQFPAAFPLFFPGLRGQVVAVAAVDDEGDPTFYTNSCGGLPADWNPELHGVHYCLAAPGGDRSGDGNGIWVATSHQVGETSDRYGYTEAQGTSFASPVVAGAFALVKQQSRSSLSDSEIVFRLMETADRTGKFADMETYGAGLLDLEAATRPVGVLMMTVPVRSAGLTRFDDPEITALPLDDNRLFVSSAFGSGLVQALADSEVAVFDELGMPFWHPLDSLLSLSSTRENLPQRRARLFPQETLLPMPGGGILSLSSYGGNTPPWDTRHGMPDPDGEDRTRLSLRRPIRGDMELLLAAGDLSRSLPLGLHTARLKESAFHNERDFPHPFLGLAGEGVGIGGSMEAGAGRIATMGFTTSDKLDSNAPERKGVAHGGLLEYSFAPASGMEIGLQAGALIEGEHLLGLRGEGGFAGIGDSSTAFAGISWNGEMNDRWRFHAQFFGGLTGLAAPSGGLIADWSEVSTSAFQLGVAGFDLLKMRDKLSISLQQPLRVEGGSTDLVIPVGRTQQGVLLRERISDIPLRPSGRELEISSRYEVALDESASLSLGAGAVVEGGHSAERDLELYVLGGARIRF